MVYFFNILDLGSITARVVFKCEFLVHTLSHEDNRERFNLTVAWSLVVAQIEQRATFPSHHENIACVLKSLCPEPQPAPQHPPAKVAKTDWPAKKQKRCSYCPAKKDRKTKTVCNTCEHDTFAKITLCSSAKIVHS